MLPQRGASPVLNRQPWNPNLNNLADSSTTRYRPLNLLGLLVCLASLYFAVIYLQQQLAIEPGPLSMISRMLVLSLAALYLLAWLHNPRQLGQRCYALLGILLSASGIGVNLRHTWLQSLPAAKTAECRPGLDYLLQNIAPREVLSTLLQGSGECAESQWTLMGLALPQQTLLLFLVLLLIQMILFRKRRQRRYFG